MTNTEKSLIAGNSIFHKMVEPALIAKINSEKLALGDRPTMEDIENPTTLETSLILEWNAKNNKINEAVKAYKNSTRMAANLFYSRVLDQLAINGVLTDIGGVTTENLASKISVITDSEIAQAVNTIYSNPL